MIFVAKDLSLLKNMLGGLKDYGVDLKTAEALLIEVRFCNESRPHMTLAYKAPARFEENFYASKKEKRVSNKTCQNSDFV